MANTVSSPNMGMPVPVVSVDPGPDWANNINSCLSVLDGHNHSSGNGVQINPAGLNINSDLTFQNNNATNFRSVRFFGQTSPLALATDVGCLYESGVDLYFNDGNGNQIRITQSGSVSGASGTITGLPSGTASASFSAGTFTFQSATNTPATMAVGPLVIGKAVASSNTITLAPNSSLASNYNLFLPTALPASLNYMTLDNSGNIGTNSSGFTGTGAVVLASSPTISAPVISGQPSGTLDSSFFLPTFTFSPNAPSASSDNRSCYIRVGNTVTVTGTLTFTISSTTGGTFITTISIPLSTTTLVANGLIVSSNPTDAGSLITNNNSTVKPGINTSIGTTTGGAIVSMGYTYCYQIN